MWSLFQLLDDDCVLDVLDVGASLIHAAPYEKLVAANRARLVGFEPDPVECDRLNERFSGVHRFFPCFVGDGKPATYHQTNWVATGSLFEPNMPLLEKFEGLAEVTTPEGQFPVTTTRLDDIADLGDIDYVKIDVQGSELNVFRNARRVLEQALVIQTEVTFVEMYKGMPLFADIDALLRANGFCYHRIDGHGVRPFRSRPAPVLLGSRQQQFWSDAIYVKDWMRLDVLSPQKLKKYAALVHDLFDSYDLAQAALLEHDRQTGQDLAGRYARRFGISVPARAPEGGLRPEPGAGTNAALTLESLAGHSYSTPGNLNDVATYALLEQERWFENEACFLERYLVPGMTVVDIGAGIGLYTVPMAAAVGSGGGVFAFEPDADSRRHLGHNVRCNALDNVISSPRALSSRAAAAAPGHAGDAGQAATDPVPATTLDAEFAQARWTTVDFLRLNVGAQGARIAAGGRRLLSDLSPLVMYAGAGGGAGNRDLRWTFAALGYGCYRLLGDGSMLVPVADDERLDAYQLNLFAAKPDRAGLLSAAGLLVSAQDSTALDDVERRQALAAMLGQPYARAFEMTPEDVEACPFADALAAYSAYRFLGTLTPERRLALLDAAFRQLHEYCQANASPAALATLARVASDLGDRQAAVAALGQIATMSGIALEHPFYPASRRFESLDPGAEHESWFKAAALEQFELARAHSSQFETNSSPLDHLKWLCASPYASGEMLRRLILVGMPSGLPARDIDGYLGTLREKQTRNLAVWASSASELQALWCG